MSSLKLAQAINERGVYCVGKLDTRTATQPYDKKTVDSVVNLLLPSERKEEITFREYSLEKLQELQSKLALISGRQSSGQEDVEKFGQVSLHFSSNPRGSLHLQVTRVLVGNVLKNH